MILNGRPNRYMRQRVMPMMYKPEQNIRSVNKPRPRQNTESWLNRLRRQDKEALPSWVKNHDLLLDGLEEAEDDANDRAGENDDDNEPEERKNYLDVIREAAIFTYPKDDLEVDKSIWVNQYSDDEDSNFDEEDVLSDAKTEDVMKDAESNVNSKPKDSDSALSDHNNNNSKKPIKKEKPKIDRRDPMYRYTISHNKHVILSVAMGYDRDSMKQVRKIINETGVALLSIGIGDRGMIGLGGYYIKKLHEISTLDDKIVNRLWNFV